MAWHLYEVVISNPRLWLKIQTSHSSLKNSAVFFEARFNGTNYTTVDGHRPVTPFRLSESSQHITNWASIVDRLPVGWNDDKFHIQGPPYPWCETLLDDCDCHGAKGRLDTAYCSDFGLHEETDKRASKSQNVRYIKYIQGMEEAITSRDDSQRKKRLQREQRSPPQGGILISANPTETGKDYMGVIGLPPHVINTVNRLVAQGLYCTIHGQHHAYGDQAIRQTLASLTGASVQMSTWDEAARTLASSKMGDIAAHWLQANQSKECAQRSVWGDADIPNILYKYIPKEHIGNGAPESLRTTQLLALNDDMECNVITMKSREDNSLTWLTLVQSEMERHLGIKVPWEELLTQTMGYGDLRLSAFIQEYLNPLVGVVSFSTDILAPTMWAHYARNTGIVVGYDTEALRAVGFELRPVVYSEIAPTYQPSKGDAIRLDFVNRKDLERDLRAGRNRKGLPILASTKLTAFGEGWKSLSRLLFVKGISWAYEKEVRLLVDLEQARDTGKEDCNDWPIKVIDPPPEAIREIYHGENTLKTDVERAIQVARGENRSGLFVGHVSSHAFRMQKTFGVRH